MYTAKTQPSTGYRSWRPGYWARKRRCLSPAARWAISHRCWRTPDAALLSPSATKRISFCTSRAARLLWAGLVYHTVPTDPSGELPLDRLRGALRDGSDAHVALPGVICLENTHNRCGGTVLSLEYHRRVRELADSIGVPVHLDGARLANAAVALGVPMSQIAAHANSVQLDLSKGLAAPVGGIVAGSNAFVARAHRARKLLGGGMRQAGVIAAAGIVALEQMVDRLADDHANARRLAEGLLELPGVVLDLQRVQTNLVVLRLDAQRWPRPEAFVEAMRQHGVLLGGFGDGRLRFATHFGIDAADIDATLAAAGKVLHP